MNDRELAHSLVSTGRLSRAALDAALRIQHERGGPSRVSLASILRERGVLGPGEAPPPSLRIGKYAIRGELGRGGMGVVYRARDEAVGRDVAIKMILDPAHAGPEAVARFQREAAAVARLRHPGIVMLHEVGQHEGKPYMVLELVDGQSLESLLKNESPPPRRIAELTCEVALALQHAHENGVIHRDVKPENVLVDRAGKAHLMDFGLARGAGAERLTATGAVMGTPAYMAPEQAEGAARDQGPHTDVYALGALLFRGLVGRAPFEAESVQGLLKKILFDEAPSLRALRADVHPDLETIALKCLQKEPRDRYARAGDVADELRRYLDGLPIQARPLGGGERVARWLRKRKRVVGAFAGLVVFVVVPLAAWPFVAHAHRLEEARAALARAREAVASGRHDDAIADARRGRELDPSLAPEAHVVAGRALHGKRDLRGAYAELALACSADARCVVAWVMRSSIALDLRETDHAIDDATRALALAPDLGLASANRALARLNARRDRAGAERDLAAALEADPRCAKALAGRAALAEQDQTFEVSVALATLAISIDPGCYWAWAARGGSRLRLGDFVGGAADVEQTLALVPTSAPHWRVLAVARNNHGDHPGALAAATRAVELDPASVDALLVRAHLRLASEPDGALEDARRVLALDRGNAEASRIVGEILYERRALDAALPHVEEAIVRNGRDAKAWYLRACIRNERNDLAGARADYDRCLELQPRHATALAARAGVRRNLGEVDGAIEDATRSLELDPRLFNAFGTRGLARATKGDPGARADFERFLELAPADHPKAEFIRGELTKLGR